MRWKGVDTSVITMHVPRIEPMLLVSTIEKKERKNPLQKGNAEDC